MFTKNDDTLNVGAQNATPLNESNETNEKTGKKINLKDAAAFAAGGVAGGAASIAASAFANTLDEQPETQVEESLTEEVEEQVQEEEPVVAPQPRTIHVEESPKQATSEEHVHHTVNQHETAESQEEPAFYRENEVKIDTIETERDEDGEMYHVASGTVNGHAAQFIDDGHGNVMGYAVDMNDNNVIDEGEIIHTENQGVTMGNLAEHMMETEVEPVSDAASSPDDVEVIAVENDVEIDGQTVNVAMLSVGESTGFLVDTNQNGEIDLMAIDTNQDGHIDIDETHNVSDEHIPMPTADDLSRDLANYEMGDEGELPDYSNDNDITLYDV